MPQDISTEVLLEKYAKDQETSIDDVNARVARALAQAELPNQRAYWQPRFADALRAGFVPAASRFGCPPDARPPFSP